MEGMLSSVAASPTLAMPAARGLDIPQFCELLTFALPTAYFPLPTLEARDRTVGLRTDRGTTSLRRHTRRGHG